MMKSWALTRGEALALFRHHRHRAAVLGPGVLARAQGLGPFLAPADRRHPRRVDALGGEIILGSVGAPVTQREVVLAGAALVAMALDRPPHRRIARQPGGLRVEHRPVLVVEIILVGVEQDAVAALADGLDEVGARAGQSDGADPAGALLAGRADLARRRLGRRG